MNPSFKIPSQLNSKCLSSFLGQFSSSIMVSKRFRRALSMDKISGLPDPILAHILSFLPVKCYVRTSVLAKRWRFLWTYVRNLHFEVYDYDSKSKLVFSDIVYRVLLLHNGAIDRLCVIPDGDIRQCRIDAWISTAIARNVQVLSLVDVWLPPCCFKCKTLVELSLKCCKISVDSSAVCLPRLKKLGLEFNVYENNESLPNLISGCSAIEDLLIRRKECDGMACCYVQSPTIKSLMLGFGFSCRKLEHQHKLVLDIPAVQCLKLQVHSCPIIGAEKLSSLVEANIRFYKDKDFEADVNGWIDMFQFVQKLSNAKSIRFITESINLLNPTFSFAATRFHNLTKLELGAAGHFLTEFLESADNLESLTIVEGKVKGWKEPKHLPKCLVSSLKYVSITGFAGGEHQLNLVRYILRHAKVLERIKIYPSTWGRDASWELKMLKQISEFPRGSPACGLTFV